MSIKRSVWLIKKKKLNPHFAKSPSSQKDTFKKRKHHKEKKTSCYNKLADKKWMFLKFGSKWKWNHSISFPKG